ncbi:uncharacterized protein LOC117832413 isoform X2 [Notolabrus celidotus]|uniref:uncharacterized protein LOC117832413 isoform X2 n=1 Tax=Notolabrus celidotus TaxID=1203425 RepID=UPI00148FF847|nr:uncharacterized protein LOC117832413 isoform X2 [Notolabrus celidotus]
MAHAELIFRHLSGTQSLQLSCSPQQDHGLLTGLHLYHRSSNSQTTLLSLSEGRELRVDSLLKGRLQLYGGLDSLQVNVTISDLQPGDTGLYLWEGSYRKRNSSEQVFSNVQKVFLLVEGTGRSSQCSPNYRPLLLTIFTAAGLLLLTLSLLAVLKCVKTRPLHGSQHSAPIYEEMTRKQQSVANARNNPNPPSHLEEVNFPVYANPNIRQPQDNYYACPRQLALRI